MKQLGANVSKKQKGDIIKEITWNFNFHSNSEHRVIPAINGLIFISYLVTKLCFNFVSQMWL